MAVVTKLNADPPDWSCVAAAAVVVAGAAAMPIFNPANPLLAPMPTPIPSMPIPIGIPVVEAGTAGAAVGCIKLKLDASAVGGVDPVTGGACIKENADPCGGVDAAAAGTEALPIKENELAGGAEVEARVAIDAAASAAPGAGAA